MGKTTDLFKKIRKTKGIFHAKIGTIKDRNSMDLTEAEDIKKRWQENKEFSSFQSLSHVDSLLMDCSTPGSLSITNLQSLFKLLSINLVMPSNHLILCHPLLLLPSIFPNIRVFSNESALHIRWPKHCSFSFKISPSNEHPGLISFRMDWLDLAV